MGRSSCSRWRAGRAGREPDIREPRPTRHVQGRVRRLSRLGRPRRGAKRRRLRHADPDFTDCSFATPEPDADWMAVMHDGGPARAFDRRMPAFGEALTEARTAADPRLRPRRSAANPAWPRGELNLPRALVTEKAFPENEAVLTTTIDASGAGQRRQRDSVRAAVRRPQPVRDRRAAAAAGHARDGGWQRGLGDVAVAVKRVLSHSLETRQHLQRRRRGRAADGQGERRARQGRHDLRAVRRVRPDPAARRLSPAAGRRRAARPTRARAGNEAFWRAALGKTFTEGRFGRAWSPMVELLGRARARGGEHGAVGPACRRCRSRSTAASTS